MFDGSIPGIKARSLEEWLINPYTREKNEYFCDDHIFSYVTSLLRKVTPTLNPSPITLD